MNPDASYVTARPRNQKPKEFPIHMMRTFAIAVSLASGLVLRGGASSKPGSDLRKAIAAASFAPSALDWAPQVNASALYGYAWSMDPAIVAGRYRKETGNYTLFTGLVGNRQVRAMFGQAQ